MRAYVLRKPGGPDALELETVPDPTSKHGEVLIRVRAFGLNRSEYFTRNGDSPSVVLPRVLGIECVGTVVDAPGTAFETGQTVAAMMGGMGRQYDGSYAELTRVPAKNVFALQTALPWNVLGAIPEMFQTVAGSLSVGVGLPPGGTLLIRGGTSSIGMTTALLAKESGATVVSTTRNPAKRQRLLDLGVDHVLIDDGQISAALRDLHPDGVDGVLELIGTTTLLDSLRCARVGGVVCMTGILGNAWSLPNFSPMGDIPTGVRLTSYSGGSGDITAAALQAFVREVEAQRFTLPIGKQLPFEDLVHAHELMDANQAGGKIVITVD